MNKEQFILRKYLLIIILLGVGLNASRASDIMNDFFPVYGVTLGKTTIKEIQEKRYKCKDSNCNVETLTFWDHDEDGIVESLYITNSDKIPDKWIENDGFRWCLSYSEWLGIFKRLNYTIEIFEDPKVEVVDERKTFSAKIQATGKKEKLQFVLDFSYGNDDGEGYDEHAPYSLYSMTVDQIE